MRISRNVVAVLVVLLFIGGCHPSKDPVYVGKTAEAPSKKLDHEIPWDPKTPYHIEEFRGAWVATVANINWPSKPGLSVEEQKEEALNLLDFLEAHHFNAVIFQVRPQADAFYQSPLEPWSYYLTGIQGQAPEPFYDPLTFWIEAAHERGLELHAWLNPYRAHHTQGGAISNNSIIKTNPELVVKLENGMYWMDPSLTGTQDRSLAVVLDLVHRYDIDGIHFDDYFYPYDSYNNGKDFPDDKSWQKYLDSGGTLAKADWRRASVNRFVKRVYSEIKAVKPFVKFGISPFGIWRPGYPESIKGYDQYEKLYADAKLWLNEGWIDYFAPQLYWKINQIDQSFPVLLGWWQNQNSQQRHLWPGLRIQSRTKDSNPDETVNQIMITRGMLPKSNGAIHWSIGPLIRQDTISNALIKGPYAETALVPSSPWLDNIPPERPSLQIHSEQDVRVISWSHPREREVFRWVLYFKFKNMPWEHRILNQGVTSYRFMTQDDETQLLDQVGITAVDRTGNQSEFFTISMD
ncbi:glycoside hydrolase family 10 protein [Aestuariivivens sediminis]|uniref:glycoside hydrolase family 10 protein n=1 Tax=Aestuariivivens sediminis TaxID=2913557 RepID=UPI001F568AF1|nr:family 10 glycosylhydrolase [Aestuariivivens sediminis]